MTPLKTCGRCGIEKPVEEFALRSSTKKGLVPRTYCIDCDVPQGQTREAARRKQLMKLYGITPEQFQQMGVEQAWLCAICQIDILAKPYVDHDHVTGKVRSLLCLHCNVGLGHFRDSVIFLQIAIEYLERHSSLERRNNE